MSRLASVATSGSYSDLSNKPTIPSAYTLPSATNSTLGGVIVGTGLSVSTGTISIADAGVISAKLADGFVYDCDAYSALVLAAPTGISGTPGVGSMALSWTPPTNTGGAALTDYIIQYSTDQTRG